MNLVDEFYKTYNKLKENTVGNQNARARAKFETLANVLNKLGYGKYDIDLGIKLGDGFRLKLGFGKAPNDSILIYDGNGMHDWGLPGIEEKWPETDEELKSWHNCKYYDLDCFGNNINDVLLKAGKHVNKIMEAYNKETPVAPKLKYEVDIVAFNEDEDKKAWLYLDGPINKTAINPITHKEDVNQSFIIVRWDDEDIVIRQGYWEEGGAINPKVTFIWFNEEDMFTDGFYNKTIKGYPLTDEQYMEINGISDKKILEKIKIDAIYEVNEQLVEDICDELYR
jgi:hypothetical protein